MDSDLKAGLKVPAMVLTTVAIAVIFIWSLGGFQCASAGMPLYDADFLFDGTSSTAYDHELMSSNYRTVNITQFAIRDIESFAAVDVFITILAGSVQEWSTDGWGYDRYSHYVESDIMCGASDIGDCLFGYTRSRDASEVYIHLIITEWDIGGLTGNQIVTLATPIDDFEVTWKRSHDSANTLARYLEGYSTYPGIESGCIVGYHLDGTIYRYGIHGTTSGPPDAHYVLKSVVDFKNNVLIEQYPMYVKISVVKENCSGDFLYSTSKWKIYDSNVTYIDEIAFSTEDVSTYVSVGDYSSFCDSVTLVCSILYISGEKWNVTINDICEYEEIFFDLEGYTRSIYGNLVGNVSITYQGDDVYSSDAGFYSFDDCSGLGNSLLVANKSGFFDTQMDILPQTSGTYWFDIYMIPIDALDTGEFGGVIYDYCTLKPILGAYVYLFNETADSGSYAYSNKYGFCRFAGMVEDMEYEVSASKDGYDASIVHSFTFNESNVNETHCKTKNLWLLPEGGCPEDEGIPTPPPAPTPTPHEWTNEEIVSWLRVNLMGLFIMVLLYTFLWFIRKAGGSRW